MIVRVVVPVPRVIIVYVRSGAVGGVGKLLDLSLSGASPVGFSSKIEGFNSMVLVVLACERRNFEWVFGDEDGHGLGTIGGAIQFR